MEKLNRWMAMHPVLFRILSMILWVAVGVWWIELGVPKWLTLLFIAVAVDWRIALLILAVFFVAYFATRYVSLGSVLASAAFGAGFAVLHYDNLTVMLCGLFMAALAIFMHRSNILRLLKGKESKTDLFGKGKKQ